jgi:hypothetical protein
VSEKTKPTAAQIDREWNRRRLVEALCAAPGHYTLVLYTDTDTKPGGSSSEFRVEIDDILKVVRLAGVFE